jgi:hypothetical protein
MAGSDEDVGPRSSGASDQGIINSGISGISGQIVVVGVLAAGSLGPFVNAFCAELGRRLGGTVADWASRVRAEPRSRTPGRVDLQVKVGADYVSATIDLQGDPGDSAHAADIVIRQVLERGLTSDEEAGPQAPSDKPG